MMRADAVTGDASTWEAASGAERSDDVACVIAVAGTPHAIVDLPRGAELAIGRSSTSAIVVDDPSVSRLHATLRWDGGDHATLIDRGSRHGTIVSGAPVRGEALVRSGAEIVIGPARFVVVLPSRRPVLAPTRRGDRLVERAAACDLPVLLVGETGVGKEVMARDVHARSARATRPFVAVNCGSIPETLAEGTLFGHEKGAFTGASARREGLFEAASGGTLFLDEIGELPLAMQVRLLRALEERAITRVGSTTPVAVDVRVIAATHRDLDAMVQRGTFRRDLLYRLDVLRIAIPALRERPEDIAALATKFLAESAPEARLAPDALALLRSHAWPGNVRELKNAIARAAALRDSDELHEKDFAELLDRARAPGGILRGRIDDAEHEALVDALEACDGNQTHAAARLGISRRALIYKMEKHGLKPRPPRS